MNKNMLAAALTVSIISGSPLAMAQAGAPGTGPNPFSDCGIGAALFPNTAWAAVTSNVIWDVGTTAVTSATASPQTCSGKTLKAALFINDTYPQLAEDIARGEGEHLTTVLGILECTGQGRTQAIASTRQMMGRVVTDPGYGEQGHLEKASTLYDVLDSAVKASCSA